MAFDYSEASIKPSKFVSRKIKFEISALTDEGELLTTAIRVATKHNGYVKKYTIRSCIDISTITFRCTKDKWPLIHNQFLHETNGLIRRVRCINCWL